jgi:hypothetical protein
MRFEALETLVPGAVLFAVAWYLFAGLGSARLRTLARCFAFATLLGLVVVPGHGEVIVAPVLAALWKAGAVAAIGLVFVAVWFGLALMTATAYAAIRARAAAMGRTSDPPSD